MRSHGLRECAAKYIRLVLAGDEDDDLSRRHHSAHAHRIRAQGHFVDGLEEALVGLTGLFREDDIVGEGREEVARFIKADVAVMTDAQKLKIDAAALADLALVLGEHRLGIGGKAHGCFPA